MSRNRNTKIVITIGIIWVAIGFNVAYGQVEDQEGSLFGKMDKKRDIIDECGSMIKLDPDRWAYTEEECFKFMNAVNANMTGLLKDNRDTIDNILYGK